MFLHVEEFIYNKWKKIFSNFAFIRFSISFEKDSNLILIFSVSKTNYFHKGIRISLAATMNESSIYSVIMLHILFNHFSASLKTLLFTKTFDPFSWDHLIKTIRNTLLDTDLSPIDFSDHSLRREVTISIVTISIPWDEIKTLRRWRIWWIDLM